MSRSMHALNLPRRSQSLWTTPTRRDPRVEFADKPELTTDIIIPNNVPVFMGTYSYVYRGYCRGHEVAIKALRVVVQDWAVMRRKMTREREIWSNLDHPNIIPLYGYTEANELFGPLGAFISPWYANGDASKFLQKHGHTLTMDERYALWEGVIAGVAYLHNYGPPIIHGDLKPGNVLIDDERNPRICDFGLGHILLESGHTGMTTTSAHGGTERYLAPELLDHEARPTIASDIYALGCIGLEFLFLEPPFSNIANHRSGMIIFERVQNNPPPARRPEVLSQEMAELWDILEACWHPTPTERITATTLLALREPVGYANNSRDPVNDNVETPADAIGIVGIVVHDFQNDKVPGALRLHRGEYIEQIEQLNDEWWYGVTISDSNRRGLFHDNHVKLIETDQVPGPITLKTVEALKPYGAGGSSGISFLKGDRITNVQVNTLTGKWKGTANGRTGSFPASYVKLVA